MLKQKGIIIIILLVIILIVGYFVKNRIKENEEPYSIMISELKYQVKENDKNTENNTNAEENSSHFIGKPPKKI